MATAVGVLTCVSSTPAHHGPESASSSLSAAAVVMGCAVTPLPHMLTEPVWSAAAAGHVMVCSWVAQGSQLMMVVRKSGGVEGWRHEAGSPVQTSWMVYVASQSEVASAACAVK